MNDKCDLSVIVLAAGKGTRMKSSRAKVLHEVFFKPMLHHVLDAIEPLGSGRTVVIVGHQEERVRDALKDYDVEIVVQQEQLGTGHAVQMAGPVIPERDGLVMILCGDTPLISTSALQQMIKKHSDNNADLTVMTTVLDNPFGYGRIVEDGNSLLAIVEEKEADENQKKIKEINAGIYLVDRRFLFEALATITPDNTQGEFYLTDIVQYAVSCNRTTQKFRNAEPLEVLGVNSRVELEEAQRQLQEKKNRELMLQGVTVINSATVVIGPATVIGVDSSISQNVIISGDTRLGRGCRIGSGVVIENCTIGNNVIIGPNSVIQNCKIGDGITLPPLTYTTDTQL
jgi:bifunctional UDP-N-acetylglucosamine pyrophosphorylase/glucosamine-1-phosphate N-acetyltransferase